MHLNNDELLKQVTGFSIIMSLALINSGEDYILFLPMNSLTKSLDGFFRIFSGVSYCAISPSFIIHILSDIFIA